MPPRKRTSETYDSDGGFVDDAPAITSKKAKTSTTTARTSAPLVNSSTSVPVSACSVDDDGNPFWSLNEKGTRRVTLNDFKGTAMVNIREMYERDGRMLPGKKGIAMTVAQYARFVEAMPGIEEVLRGKGVRVGRPRYEARVDEEMGEGEEGGKGEEEAEETADGKRNFEATSEEED